MINKKIKVAHLTSAHPVYDIRIFHKQCKSLQGAGYDVTLIAKAEKDSVVENIKITAIQGRKNRFKRFFSSTWDVYKEAIKNNATIYHFHDPELIPIGVLLRLRGKKVIYDVHEDLPRQILNKYWINPWLRYPVSWLASSVEWLSSQFIFSKIVTVTPKIASRFPDHKTVQVRNYPQVKESIADSSSAVSKKQIAYMGSIDKTRGIIENIKAFGLLNNTAVKMLLAGPFSSIELEEECRSLNEWKQVEYHSWLTRNEVMIELANSCAGLVVLHPTPSYVDSYPIKMFEYMSAGIPVIASDFPLWRKIIDGNSCGILVNPMKPKEIANAIDWIIEHPEEAREMGKNGRKAVEKKYNWRKEEEKLIKLYNDLTLGN